MFVRTTQLRYVCKVLYWSPLLHYPVTLRPYPDATQASFPCFTSHQNARMKGWQPNGTNIKSNSLRLLFSMTGWMHVVILQCFSPELWPHTESQPYSTFPLRSFRYKPIQQSHVLGLQQRVTSIRVEDQYTWDSNANYSKGSNIYSPCHRLENEVSATMDIKQQETTMTDCHTTSEHKKSLIMQPTRSIP